MSSDPTNLFYMWDYPSGNEILNANVGKVSEWVDRQLRSFMASRKKLADVYGESQDLAIRLVEESFPSAPKLGPPIGTPDNGSSNGSIVVGAVTAGALLLMSPVLGPISLLGIPAVIFWMFMAKATREPADTPQRRAERELESRLYSWNKSKEMGIESLTQSLKGRFNLAVAEEFGVPKRLWPAFFDAIHSWQTLPFTSVKAEIQAWANQPEYPEAPGQIEEGVSHEQYEAYCCSVMHHWGYMDAETTRYTRDGGIDIESADFVAQCKHVAGTVGAPDVQRIFGIAVTKHKQALIFSAGTFSKAAIKFANDAGVGAVVISEINGTVRPQNGVAEEIIQRNQSGPA